MAEPCRLLSCYLPASRYARVEGATTEENIQLEGGNVSLPDDILFEVLSRLPVKPLYRLRCVSKAWRALISDPAFAAARPLVVGTFGEYHTFPPEPLQLGMRVIDTADGSVVRVVKDVGMSTHRCSPSLAPTRLRLLFVDQGLYGGKVIDPATGRVTTVAGLKALDDEVPGLGYCHSFLGRAAPCGAYKITRVRGNWVGPPEKLQSIEVATLGDAAAAASGEQPTWRQRPAPPFRIDVNSAATVDDDGVVHFMEGDVTPTSHGARMRIAAFDLESEEWKTAIYGPPAACPGQEGGTTWDVALAELKGALSVVQNVALGSRHVYAYINIWRLVDAAQSIWVKECTIRMDESCFVCRPVEVFQDGRVMLSSAFMRQPKDPFILQLYNSSTGAVTNIMEMPQDFLFQQITLYTGSLLS